MMYLCEKKYMLLKDFYKITEQNISDEGNKINCKIEINPKHEVFKGHFPQIPIVPGVSLVQIIKEIVSGLLTKELFMNKADSIKFMHVINPVENNKVDILINLKRQESSVSFDSKAFLGEIVYFKFKGQFQFLPGVLST